MTKPSGDILVIEARVDPNDIDIVHTGLTAQVRIAAFSTRSTVSLEGEVTSVSADRLIDERTGLFYYLVRVRLTGDVAKVLDRAELRPGMPAEVMIATGTRTALDYIFKPIFSDLNRSFREQ
ncbi:MAG: HlyD family secretion protein [Proteobacteria bacterium]|nr:HlyD family secretion protein [Pseudomonadota bacterium]